MALNQYTQRISAQMGSSSYWIKSGKWYNSFNDNYQRKTKTNTDLVSANVSYDGINVPLSPHYNINSYDWYIDILFFWPENVVGTCQRLSHDSACSDTRFILLSGDTRDGFWPSLRMELHSRLMSLAWEEYDVESDVLIKAKVVLKFNPSQGVHFFWVSFRI